MDKPSTSRSGDFEEIPVALPDAALRAQVFNYFNRVLVRHKEREPNKAERENAALATILQFPQLIDYYIRMKEDSGDEATHTSAQKVVETEQRFIHQLRELQEVLGSLTRFYRAPSNTYRETHSRLAYLKDVIENKGGHRMFYYDGKPLQREERPPDFVQACVVRHTVEMLAQRRMTVEALWTSRCREERPIRRWWK